ncbi:MAG: amidohydrolase family protein [Myxococcota bacterium]
MDRKESPVREYRLIDADSHTLEPPHIWDTWLPKKFQNRAPQLVKDKDGGDAWQFQRGTPPMEIGLVTTPGRRYEDIKWTGYTYDTIRKSCFEPKARLEDMDFDGIDGSFLYPSQRTMFFFMGNPDRDFHLAGVQAYNSWLAQEFCAVDPERLFGLAQMPNLGVDAMIDEMKRCKELGFRGAIITTWPTGADDLTTDDDKFFAAAADLEMPVSIHIQIQRKRNPKATLEGVASIATMALAGMLMFPPIMSELIMTGLFDRIPKLTIVGVETEVGWIPEALEQIDNFYWRNRTRTGLELKHLPSEYFHRHFVCTFIKDAIGIQLRHDVGVQNMAWSTDFPHHGCDWPYSRKVVGEMMVGVPQAERYEILAGNMVRIYKLPQGVKV